jgi:hypothetical protein
LARGSTPNDDKVVLNRMHQASSVVWFTQDFRLQKWAPSRLRWHEIRSGSVYGSAGAETIPASVTLAFMRPPFYSQFLRKWFAHSNFASPLSIRGYAFHREIESAMPAPPDSKTRK